MTSEPIRTDPSVTSPDTEKAAAPTKASEKGAASPTNATRAPRGGKAGQAAAKAGKAAKKPTTPAVKPARGKDKAKAEDTKKPDGGRKARSGTKQEQLIAMLRRTDGATVEEVAKTFGWQAHTVRGALYGALKTKLGLNIVSEKVEGRGRVYRIAG
jgi:Protein of unknown function (DUF3489)